MADIQTHTLGTDGFTSKSQVGDFTIDIDALGDDGPTPNQVLVADYASCVLPAFRVGGSRPASPRLFVVEHRGSRRQRRRRNGPTVGTSGSSSPVRRR